jgi:hypothetical protein
MLNSATRLQHKIHKRGRKEVQFVILLICPNYKTMKQPFSTKFKETIMRPSVIDALSSKVNLCLFTSPIIDIGFYQKSAA